MEASLLILIGFDDVTIVPLLIPTEVTLSATGSDVTFGVDVLRNGNDVSLFFSVVETGCDVVPFVGSRDGRPLDVGTTCDVEGSGFPFVVPIVVDSVCFSVVWGTGLNVCI